MCVYAMLFIEESRCSLVWLQIVHRLSLSGLGVWSVYLAGEYFLFFFLSCFMFL